MVPKEEILKYFASFGRISSHSFGNRFLIVEYSEPSVAQKVLSSKHYIMKRPVIVKQRKVKNKNGTYQVQREWGNN